MQLPIFNKNSSNIKTFTFDPSPLAERPTPFYGERTKTSGYAGAKSRQSKLSFTQIEAMRTHPIVKFCLQFLKMPLARVPINIQCDNNEMQAILTAIINPVLNDYLRQAAQCLDYGFWPAEVRWERRVVQYEIDGTPMVKNCIALKTFKGLKQEYTNVIENEYGGFQGINYSEGGNVNLMADEGKCLLVINRHEQADRYGISELLAAKKPWDKQVQIEAFSTRYYETKADPIPVIRYDGVNKYAVGETVLNNKQVAYEMGLAARQGRPIALPSNSDEKGKELWGISYLEASDRAPLFRNAMEYHDVQMMRAILVPERSLTQSEATGSYSMAEAHGSFLIERQEEVIDLLIEALNKYVLPRVIEYNFGKVEYEAKLVSAGLREADKELTKQVIGAIMASSEISNEQREWIEKRTGIPFEQKEAAPVATPQMKEHSCGHVHEFAERKYHRQLQPFEKNVKLAAIDNYMNNWLERSSSVLFDVYRRQAEGYLAELKSILLNNPTVSARLNAVRKIELINQATYRSTINEALYQLLDTAAMYCAQELKVNYGGLDPVVSGWARAQADNVWYGHDGDIRARANVEAITSIAAELPDKTILYNVKGGLDTVMGTTSHGRIYQAFLLLSSEAINQGRASIMRLYNKSGTGEANPIVAVIRSELLDETVCRYCREILDMKIIDTDNPDYEPYFLVKPHIGCRGINIFIRQNEEAEYRNNEKYKWKRPTDAQLERWVKEKGNA